MRLPPTLAYLAAMHDLARQAEQHLPHIRALDLQLAAHKCALSDFAEVLGSAGSAAEAQGALVAFRERLVSAGGVFL